MNNSYSSLCDAFYVDMHINTELDLPTERDTILAFFERIEKQFPSMGSFYRRDNGDFCLEETKLGERYRWVNLEIDRISSGCADPQDLQDAFSLQQLILQLAPYMLGVNHLDVDSLDLTFAMDFDYQGNHNEVIADAFFNTTAFSSLLELPDSKPIGFSPTVLISLSDDCRTQLRLSIEARTSAYEIRNRKFKENEPISLYMTVRQYPKPDEKFDPAESFAMQCRLAQDLMAEKIIPNFVTPLTSAIAQRR